MTKTRREPIAARLARAAGGRWTPFREEGEFGWSYHCDDGRVARRYASPVLGWDGYRDDKFNSYLSCDGGWTRLLCLGTFHAD